MQELEAKYLLQEGSPANRTLRRVLQSLSWAGFMARPNGRSRIHDTYYDTRSGLVQMNGWSLRLRVEDDSRVLTCKSLGRGRRAVFEREEIEQPFTDLPDDEHLLHLDMLDSGQAVDFLREFLPPDARLRPLFELRTTRTRYLISHLQQPSSALELARDRCRIRAASPAEYYELELELKRGGTELLDAAAAVLDHEPALLPARVSKYQRGLLAAGCAPSSQPTATDAPLTPGSQWVDLGIRHLTAQVLLLRHFEPLAWESIHIEGVHQMRVITRRLRAGLRAFANVLPEEAHDALTADVRWLGSALGRVRDLDVQRRRVRQYPDKLHRDDRLLLKPYDRHLQKSRRRATRRLRTALDSPRYARLPQALRQYLDAAERQKNQLEFRTIEDTTTELLPRALDRILARGRKVGVNSEPERLHKLRIAIKRLRYQLEYLSEPYGEQIAGVSKRLRRLQNTLGNHQDAFVAQAQLAEYQAHHELGKRERRLFRTLHSIEEDKAERCHHRFFKDWHLFEEEALALRRNFR